jgi:membrane-associated phospholipid phosphatase
MEAAPASGASSLLALLPGLAALVLANARPLHKYVRAALAPPFSAMAQRQMHWLAAIQRHRLPLLDSLCHASAMSVSVEFYVALLPLLFWLGWQEVAMKLILGLSLCCFVCFAWKDLLCCPRPRHLLRHPGAPPVVVTEDKAGEVEYGAPSGHVALSVCLNLYLANELVQSGIVAPGLAAGMHACSALWVLWIAYGRMHLGMHTPVDLATGALVGLCTLGLWANVDELCLAWLRASDNALPYSLAAFAAAIFHWPSGDDYTTSFLEAGVTFLGAAFGACWCVPGHYEHTMGPAAAAGAGPCRCRGGSCPRRCRAAQRADLPSPHPAHPLTQLAGWSTATAPRTSRCSLASPARRPRRARGLRGTTARRPSRPGWRRGTARWWRPRCCRKRCGRLLAPSPRGRRRPLTPCCELRAGGWLASHRAGRAMSRHALRPAGAPGSPAAAA